MSDNRVFMCTKCDVVFRTEINGKCLSCRNGEVKGYNENSALVINTLDRATYNVLEHTIPNDIDLKRELRIDFEAPSEFTHFEPPKGFIYERGKKPIDLNGNALSTVSIYKQYRADMPTWKYAIELAQDKARLTKWVFSLPLVKELMKY